MPTIYYAMGLHMHQPPQNLKLLIEHNEWEAQQIIKCYDRAAQYALDHPEGAFHVDFSGVLLEQFLDPDMIDRYRRFVDIPQMLDKYRRAKNIEIVGMGYYHPIFPLIPREDWEEQLNKGVDIFKKIFNQRPRGFWPSEMAFCMEMIPALTKAGYEYIVVDHVHVKPKGNGKALDCFAPYIAGYGGQTMTIIPRNRDLSNAQESGLNPEWFMTEVRKKIAESPAPNGTRLVTTWSDGENGGWFRQMDANAGFFGYFWQPLLAKIKSGDAKIQTIKISEFLKKHPAIDYATVQTGAWNVGSTSGYDFGQWNGSESQKKAIKGLFEVSGRYWQLKSGRHPREQEARLAEARKYILDAETSCYLFWGEAWLPKIYERLDLAKKCLW